jgi:hypothetical protein
MITIKLYSLDFTPLGYLKSFDPDVGTDTVTGDVVATQDIDKAMKFYNMGEAIAFVAQQSTRVPLRPDGYPNRPLTAFTTEFETV